MTSQSFYSESIVRDRKHNLTKKEKQNPKNTQQNLSQLYFTQKNMGITEKMLSSCPLIFDNFGL